ncbi:MAG: DUF6640 family protein [Opitutaceae bacterium]
MNRLMFSRLVLSALLVTSTVASFVLDWKSNHLLNPAWHPHARFHGGLLLFTLAGVAATALWLLWRRSPEPLLGLRAATALLLAYWTPLFYVNSLVPGSSLWAGPAGQEPRWGGTIVYPNLVVAALFVIAAVVALRIGTTATRSLSEP